MSLYNLEKILTGSFIKPRANASLKINNLISFQLLSAIIGICYFGMTFADKKMQKEELRRLSENALLLRPAANSADLRWQAQNGLNVAMATPSVVLYLPPCPRNFRSVSRQSHSRTASWGEDGRKILKIVKDLADIYIKEMD